MTLSVSSAVMTNVTRELVQGSDRIILCQLSTSARHFSFLVHPQRHFFISYEKFSCSKLCRTMSLSFQAVMKHQSLHGLRSTHFICMYTSWHRRKLFLSGRVQKNSSPESITLRIRFRQCKCFHHECCLRPWLAVANNWMFFHMGMVQNWSILEICWLSHKVW